MAHQNSGRPLTIDAIVADDVEEREERGVRVERKSWGLGAALGAMGGKAASPPAGRRRARTVSESIPPPGKIRADGATDRTAAGAAAAVMARTQNRVGEEIVEERAISPERTPRYPHLQEAAKKEAEARLARIGYDQARARAKTRGRSLSLGSSLTGPDGEDKAARQKKGQEAVVLMDRAKRNVDARLKEQERAVAEKRGIPRSEDWDRIAMEHAERKREERRVGERGADMVDVGGGQWVEREMVEELARRNVKPVMEDFEKEAKERREKEEEEKARKLERRAEKDQEKRSRTFFKKQQKEARRDCKSPLHTT